MKILHLCLGSFYMDNCSYQENLLPYFHLKMGLDVEIISFIETDNSISSKVYSNEYGIKVTRLNFRWNNKIGRKLKWFIGLYDEIEKAKPDIIFIHGAQFMDVDEVVKYVKKHINVIVYVDNHADFANSATNIISKAIHKILWRHCFKEIEPYAKKIYGVSPARVSFLKEVYKMPPEKCELLVMGADDELVEKVSTPMAKRQLRAFYGIEDDEFLVVTGGKINQYRPETLNLMKAVANNSNPNIKMLIFGSVSDEYKREFDDLMKSPKIQFAGWQNAEGTYSIMAAADLIVFPGLHSVMWEQAVAVGVPCVFRDIEGFHHIDLGGNVMLLNDVSESSLKKTIETLIEDDSKYKSMKSCAMEKGMEVFSYREIARRSIEQ